MTAADEASWSPEVRTFATGLGLDDELYPELGAVLTVPVGELEQVGVVNPDGAVTVMTLPPEHTIQRQWLEQRIARGELAVVDIDHVETIEREERWERRQGKFTEEIVERITTHRLRADAPAPVFAAPPTTVTRPRRRPAG